MNEMIRPRKLPSIKLTKPGITRGITLCCVVCSAKLSEMKITLLTSSRKCRELKLKITCVCFGSINFNDSRHIKFVIQNCPLCHALETKLQTLRCNVLIVFNRQNLTNATKVHGNNNNLIRTMQ